MSWIDELCVSCGVCCTSLSVVRITQTDVDRLIAGYNLSTEQAGAMFRREDSQFRILMDNHAACGALSARGGRYTCQAYLHRPGICREFECYILAAAKDWFSKRSSEIPVDTGNPFHEVSSEGELKIQVQTAIERMRADNLTDCEQLRRGARGRVYDHLPELVETLSGKEFDPIFPAAPRT